MRTNDKSNLAYDYGYLYGQTAALPKRNRELEEERRQKRVEELRRRRAQDLAKKRKELQKKQQLKLKSISILLAVAVSVLFGGIIYRYASISETNSQINKLKTQLATETNKVSELNMEYTMAQNLDTIRDKAKQLGMDFPNSDQIVYFDLNGETSGS